MRTSSGPHSPGLAAELLDARAGHGLAPLAEQLVAAWRDEPDTPGEAVALALATAAETSERMAQHRSDVAVTGPGSSHTATRLTPAVVTEAIRDARAELLVVTFAAAGIADVVTELVRAAERGVRIDVVLDDTTGARDAFRRLDGAASFWHWPAERRGADGRAAMHAKLLAADRSWALVGSANLTGRAMRENLELGVLLRDSAAVERVVRHVHTLMGSHGPLVRVLGNARS